MNLIDESVDYKKKDNSKKTARIILIFIALINNCYYQCTRGTYVYKK